jgi:hypothetical protein
MRARVIPLALAALVVVSACASAASGAPGRRTSSMTITPEEISTSGAENAYQLVQSLRPEWLRARGLQSLSESTHTVGREGKSGTPVANGDPRVQIPGAGRPQVWAYLNHARLGEATALQQIRASDVASLQFLSAAQASLRYGSDNTHGAIVVILR